MRVARVILVGVALALIACGSAVAQNNLTGDDILTQLKDDISLTGSGYATLDLVTQNKKGDQRENRLIVYRSDDGTSEKQLVEDTAPADVKGSKFLSVYEEGDSEPEMWLYLPALGKERRIAGHMTKGSFMGTDFTYEEIAGGQSYRDDYQAVRSQDDELDGYLCYTLDLTPKASDSEYSRVRMWVWQDEMMPLRIDFFNGSGQLSKRLVMSDLRQDEGGTYTPYRISMSNELAGTMSIIKIVETSRQVDDSYFTLRYLRQ